MVCLGKKCVTVCCKSYIQASVLHDKHICDNGVKLFFCLVFPNSQISKKSIMKAVHLNLQNDETDGGTRVATWVG